MTNLTLWVYNKLSISSIASSGVKLGNRVAIFAYFINGIIQNHEILIDEPVISKSAKVRNLLGYFCFIKYEEV